jgi:predicted phage-related endonuclease
MPFTLFDPGDFTIYRDVERPYIFCTPDRLIMDGDKIVAPLELKTAHFGAAKTWNKECPVGYLCQMQLQMYVLKCNVAYVAVLLEGRAFRWHRVARHQKFIDKMLAKLDRFWERYVIGREAPPTDFSQATADALARKYPAANGATVELPAELEPLIAEYDELTKTESAATKRKDEIKNLLKSKIGDARYGSFGSKDGFQWNGDGGKRTFRRAKNCPEPVSS